MYTELVNSKVNFQYVFFFHNEFETSHVHFYCSWTVNFFKVLFHLYSEFLMRILFAPDCEFVLIFYFFICIVNFS